MCPTQVNLFLQRLDSTGQPMGGHAHTGQTFVFQKIDFVDQSYHLRCFKKSQLLAPGLLEFGESADKRREAGFVVLTIEPCLVPSRREDFKGRSRKPTRGRVWSPTPIITFRLAHSVGTSERSSS
jgi:hypothetical protein